MTARQMKSRVMALGNRLTARLGGDRRAAFVEAWAIVKAGGMDVPVRGVSFGSRQEALSRLAGYDPSEVRAFLVPEPGNPHDPGAVAVMVGVQGGRGLYRLGYLPRGTAAAVALAVRGRATVRVSTGTVNGARLRLTVGR